MPSLLKRSVVLAGLLTLVATASAQDEPEPLVHTIDPSTTFQTIDHFGASDCWTMGILGQWSEERRERVAELLFSRESGIGLSLWRFNLGAGLQPERIKNPLRTKESFEVAPGEYDWSRMKDERAMLLAAKRHGVHRFHAFALSGTPRMTRNGFVNADPGDHSTNLLPEAEDDYTTYLADVLEHFAKGYPEAERVEFDWISPVNEPQWDWNGGSHEGTRASNDDIRRVGLLLGRELEERGLRTRLHLVESGSIPDMYAPNAKATKRYGTLFGDYVDALLGDDELAPFLDDTVGYHSYWSDGGGVFGRHRAAFRAKLDEYPAARVFQTEYCIMKRGRDLGMDAGLHLARVLHGDLSIVNVSGWSWWLAFSPHDYRDSLLHTDWKRPGDEESILWTRMFWVLGNHSRFVRPGMVRIAIGGDGLQSHAGVLATAYRGRMDPDDPGSEATVVVYVNSGSACTVQLQLTGDDEAPRTQQTWITSDSAMDLLRGTAATKSGKPIRLKGRSVTTVVLR